MSPQTIAHYKITGKLGEGGTSWARRLTHATVSELCQNPPFHEVNNIRLRAKQIPQVNENRNGEMELM